MSNACKIEEVELVKSESEQPTFKDILQELNRLRLENGCLKADKQELLIENEQLRNDNNELHNKFDTKEDFIKLEIAYQSDINNNDETDYEAWSKALENVSLRRFNY